MIREYESIQGDNLEESDMAQLLSVTANADAVARIRAAIPTGPSQSHCEECGEEIPMQRQLVVKGCKTCIECQNLLDRRKKVYGQ
jgi:phage/conjugal plasmid C-4 type zinc finger TraR family protein